MASSIFSQVFLPACLFIIMFGMGLSLTIGDFTRVVRFPKAVILGTFGQMVLLPLVGFGVAALLLPTAPALAVGLVLLAACPGGTTSNMVTHLARGDLALSITLTAISSLATTITIPLIVGLALTVFADKSVPVEVPVARMMGVLFVITLLPVGLGMLVRRASSRIAGWLEPKINLFAMLFLVALIVLISIKQGDRLVPQILSAGPATLALNGVMMVMGFLAARAARLNADQSTSITLEIGIQNSTLAILIATSLLGNSAMAIPAGVYSLAMYLSGGFVVALRARQRRAAAFSDGVTRLSPELD